MRSDHTSSSREAHLVDPVIEDWCPFRHSPLPPPVRAASRGGACSSDPPYWRLWRAARTSRESGEVVFSPEKSLTPE
eukprot:8467711-Alexandrium_andersonii.AAC.1